MAEYGKQYFRVIKTDGHNLDMVLKQHEEKLNNYQKYGIPLTDEGYSKLVNKGIAVVDREIESSSSNLVNHNNTWYKVSELCCEDKEPTE